MSELETLLSWITILCVEGEPAYCRRLALIPLYLWMWTRLYSKRASTRLRQRRSSLIRPPSPPSQTATPRRSWRCRRRLAPCATRPFLTLSRLYAPLHCCLPMMIRLPHRWLSSLQRRKWYRSVTLLRCILKLERHFVKFSEFQFFVVCLWLYKKLTDLQMFTVMATLHCRMTYIFSSCFFFFFFFLA